MAALCRVTFETRQFTTSKETNGEGQETLCTGAPVTDTSIILPWGSASIKFPKGSVSSFKYAAAGATGRGYWVQAAVYLDHKPKTEVDFLFAAHSGGNILEIAALASGELTSFEDVPGTVTELGYKLEFGKWYVVELYVEVNTTSTGKWTLWISDTEGTLLKEVSKTGRNLGSTAPTEWGIGNLEGDTECNVYGFQFGLNDPTGERENGRIGAKRRFGMLKAVSDNSREGMVTGAGGTEGLYKAVSKSPPGGVANGSKTAESQIYSGTSSTTHFYRATTGEYEAAVASGGAGMGPNDVVKLAMGIARISNSSATARSMGLKVAANPEIAEVTANTISGTAASTEPTGWKTIVTAPSYAPAVTKSSGATPNIRKNAATTDATACDMLGVIIDWEPVANPPKLAMIL